MGSCSIKDPSNVRKEISVHKSEKAPSVVCGKYKIKKQIASIQ